MEDIKRHPWFQGPVPSKVGIDCTISVNQIIIFSFYYNVLMRLEIRYVLVICFALDFLRFGVCFG